MRRSYLFTEGLQPLKPKSYQKLGNDNRVLTVTEAYNRGFKAGANGKEKLCYYKRPGMSDAWFKGYDDGRRNQE